MSHPAPRHDPENVRVDDHPHAPTPFEPACDEYRYTNPYLKSFGSSVRWHRKNQGLSQKKLAMLAGTTPAQLCQMEHGKLLPSHRVACQIAKVLRRRSLTTIISNERAQETLRKEARVEKEIWG